MGIQFTPEQEQQLRAMPSNGPVVKKLDPRIMRIGQSKNNKGYLIANKTAIFARQLKAFIYLMENKVTIKDLRERLELVEKIHLVTGPPELGH